MFKKKEQHLQPIKITKTEANYQMLMLEMMNKLVHEQRQSNRLLKNITGEEQKSHEKLPPLTPNLEKKAESSGHLMPPKRDHFSESASMNHQSFDRGLTPQQRSQHSIASSKDGISFTRIAQDFFSPMAPNNNDDVTSRLESLGQVLGKIEEQLAQSTQERQKDRLWQIERQRERGKERDRERQREKQRQKEREKDREWQRERESLRQKERQRQRARAAEWQKQLETLKEKDSRRDREPQRERPVLRAQSRLRKPTQVIDEADGESSMMLESQVRPALRKEGSDDKKGDDFGILEAENVSKKKIDINKLSTFRKTRLMWKDSQSSVVPQVAYSALTHPQITNKNVFDKIAHISEKNQDPSNSDLSPIRPQIEKEVEQKKNYAVLSEILPYSDRREIKIKFSVEDIYNFYKSRGEAIEINRIAEEWLGLVYRATASICWNMISNHLLTFEETKILFTENIIYNFIEFMKSTESLGYGSFRVQIVENINLTAVSILDFLCTQYPQTKVEDPNIALRSEIPSIDNKGLAKFDFIGRAYKKNIIHFKKKRRGDYTPEIMKVINLMIDQTNSQFDGFSATMSDIFEEIFLPYKKRKQSDRPKPQDNSELQMYYEKVKAYTKFVIGRKINKNTLKYSQPQIENGVFFVKSPSILRLITKWVEQLDEIVRHPEKQIKNYNRQFMDSDGLPMHLYAQVKNGVFRAIKENQERFYEKMRSIKRQCYNMEVLLTYSKFITDPQQIHLSQEQISVGKYCTYLKSAIASYICSELNSLIDFLLQIPGTVDETKIGITDLLFQEQSRKDLDNLNLVGFKIFDLLRCKCISKESEIIYLLKRLNEKSNDPEDPFRIVRIKDRLGTGTRDIVINAQFNKGLVCQIQLAVVSNMEKKQQLLDQYNHFLYELKRAKLGSITQSASIWSALEQRAHFFELDIGKGQIICNGKVPHPCLQTKKPDLRKLSDFPRPIICASCKNFFEIPRTCLSNVRCEDCEETFCGECHFQHLRDDTRKDYIFQKIFFKCLYPFIREYTDYKKALPRYGFLVRKPYLKKELFFYRVITKENQNSEKEDSVNMELVYSGVQHGQFFNKTINKVELQAIQIDGELYLEQNSKKEFEDFIIYEIVKLGKGMQKVTIPYKDLLNQFQKLKIRYVNLMKHPVYVEDIKLFKKPKIIEKEIQSFKKIFKDDTQITYLKVHRTVFILQVEVQEDVLQKQLIKLINIKRLKNYASDKSNSVSMEFREVTDEMDMIKTKFTPQLLTSFSQRLSKLYLNFGYVSSLTFLELFPNIKVLYIRNNKLSTLDGVENLASLGVLCFDNNTIKSLEPISQLVSMTQISGTGNQIQCLKGIQKLVRLKKIRLFQNKIKKMEFFENLPRIQELALNLNPIQKIQSIFHLKDIEELNFGKTLVVDLKPLVTFGKIKKLSLNGLNLTNIGPIFKELDELVRLNLATNRIEKMENLSELTELVQLNLRQNRISKIEGLTNCIKLQILKMGVNFVTDVSGIKALENLKLLKLPHNPLADCTQFHLMSRKHFKLVYSKSGQAESEQRQPKPEFYERYHNVLEHRISSSSGSGSGSGSSDSDSN